jgi:hypothetical protein
MFLWVLSSSFFHTAGGQLINPGAPILILLNANGLILFEIFIKSYAVNPLLTVMTK